MKPISPNASKYGKNGCMPVSASCVVWNGPDISCINLCSGDTIDEVVYQLAQILCDITENVLDVTTLDFECLLAEGQAAPDTLLETLQLIITNACTPDPPPPPTPPTPLPDVQLPDCLYYVNSEGDTVTALPLDEYAAYLASIICRLIADINSINAVITTINTRVTILESIVSGGGSTPPVTTVVTQCLSNNTTPGESLPIDVAFYNLEQRLCEYTSLLGSVTSWQNMLNNVCIDANTPQPCSTTGATYGDVPGWISNVQTVADAMTNLWLVVCTLNDCMTTTPSPVTCVPIPPVSVTISSITTIGATITWVAPVTTGVQAPIAYKVEVYDIAGTIPPIVSVIVGTSPLSYQILDPTITTVDTYIVKVFAIYDCGTSTPAVTQGLLKEPAYVAKLHYTNAPLTATSESCFNPVTLGTTNFIERENLITIELRDNSGNPVINTGTPIETTIRLEYDGCTGIVEEDVVITINSSSSFGTATYTSESVVYCVGVGCTPVSRTVLCWAGSEVAGGAPLPSTIGIDTSLSGLGTC
jgi:hypothetical protein